MTQRYRPNVTVACVLHCQGQFLMVEEMIDGQQKFNQPAGHLEANESLVAACEREIAEETGLTNAAIQGLVGIYQYTASPELAFLRFTFFCELASMPTALIPQDKAITATHWLRLDDIKRRSAQLRSPLVLQCIEDYLSGKQIPLDVLSSQFLAYDPNRIG